MCAAQKPMFALRGKLFGEPVEELSRNVTYLQYMLQAIRRYNGDGFIVKCKVSHTSIPI